MLVWMIFEGASSRMLSQVSELLWDYVLVLRAIRINLNYYTTLLYIIKAQLSLNHYETLFSHLFRQKEIIDQRDVQHSKDEASTSQYIFSLFTIVILYIKCIFSKSHSTPQASTTPSSSTAAFSFPSSPSSPATSSFPPSSSREPRTSPSGRRSCSLLGPIQVKELQ